VLQSANGTDSVSPTFQRFKVKIEREKKIKFYKDTMINRILRRSFITLKDNLDVMKSELLIQERADHLRMLSQNTKSPCTATQILLEIRKLEETRNQKEPIFSMMESLSRKGRE
jgi:hypothetical protein